MTEINNVEQIDQDDDGCNTEDDHELQDWRDEQDYLEDMAESAHS